MTDHEKLEALQKNLNEKALAFLKIEEEMSKKIGTVDMVKYEQIRVQWQIATYEYVTHLRAIKKVNAA